MKKLWSLLSCLVLIFGLLTVNCAVSADEALAPVESNGKNTSAAKAMPLTEAGVTDALNKETAQRWYTVEITEPGDAVVTFYNERIINQRDISWECTLFGQDKTTVLATLDVGDGCSFMAANDLTEGTYYLRVQTAEKAADSDSTDSYGYCKGEYTLNIVTCATPVAIDPADYTVDKAGDLLCVVDGHLFIKAADGEAVAGAYVNEDGQAGPLLLCQMQGDAVDYFSSATGKLYTWSRSNYVHFDGESNGYYTSSKYGLVDGGTIINADGLYICYAGDAVDEKRAARQLMNMHRGVDPMEGLGWDNFMASAAAPWVFGGVVVAVLVIIVVVHKRSEAASKAKTYRLARDDDDTPSSYTPPTPASSDDDDPLPWTANHDNAKDM